MVSDPLELERTLQSGLLHAGNGFAFDAAALAAATAAAAAANNEGQSMAVMSAMQDSNTAQFQVG